MSDPDFEEQCRWKCRYCQRAFEWEQRGSKGHTLRFRSDSLEWVHDFYTSNGPTSTNFEHRLCDANEMRKKRG